MLEQGNVIHNQYEIVRTLGHGGMSTVYLVRDTENGKPYAIKDVKRSKQDSDNNVVVQSLAVEGNMLKTLSSQHLPKIYDIVEEPDNFLLVMDYVEGESLDRRIMREGGQSPDLVYQIGLQICDVLEYLHGQSPPVVYRDMKPANVIMQPDGNIVLIDFGTARTQKMDRVMSSDTICIGTVGFAAPEQYGGNGQSDARTDIYCLGATIYNLLTGHSPCDPPKGIRPLEQFVPELANSPLEEIIHKCTQNDPDERYQTAAELREALQMAQAGIYNKRGLTGRLRRNGFQHQSTKGAQGKTGVLSALLGSGKGETKTLFDDEPSAFLSEENNSLPPEEAALPPQGQEKPWRELLLITAAVTVVLLIVSILFAVLGSVPIAVVSICLTVCAAILAVYSYAKSISQKQ